MRNVIVQVDGQRRIRVYPEGGVSLEVLVTGVGWVADNDAHVSDDSLADILTTAAAALGRAADRMRPRWTPAEILAREG